MPGHLGAVSLKKSHDIVILSFCNIVKGQARCQGFFQKMRLMLLTFQKCRQLQFVQSLKIHMSILYMN